MDKKALLELAAESIRARVGGQATESSPDLSASLDRPAGVFVSLYVKNKLRGCIGTFAEERGLIRNTREMAVAAASNDSRFKPIQATELEQLRIEISVLTPRRRVSNPEEVEPGRHGIYLVHGSRAGTLLPQVAVKQGWDAETFLDHCGRYKAGLAPGEWRSAEIYTYEACIITTENTSK